MQQSKNLQCGVIKGGFMGYYIFFPLLIILLGCTESISQTKKPSGIPDSIRQYIPPGHPPKYDEASLNKLIGLPIKTITYILGPPEDDYYLEVKEQRQLQFYVLYKPEFSDPEPTRVLLIFEKRNKSDWICIRAHPL
jgi:hypothetical protein